MRSVLFLSAAVLLLQAACGAGGTATDAPEAAAGGNAHGMHSMSGDDMGEPADPEEADRTVKIMMLDELAYDPEKLQVAKGEVVTFEITNRGETRHEFVLGDKDFQAMHEGDMKADHQGGQMSSGLSLAAGEKGSLTWRFTRSGEVLYGCHEPGHYEGGMMGSIAVN